MSNDSEDSALWQSNFAELLARGAARFGDRPVLVHGSETTAHDALASRAASIAAALESHGLQRGDACAVMARAPDDAAAAFFAVLGIGGVGINVNELYRPRQVEHVLHNAQARAILIARELLTAFPRQLETSAQVILLEDIVTTPGARFTPVAVHAEAPAQITYTSGSTGQPKGVVMSHANLWAGVRVVARYLGLRPDDRIASVLPFSFVYGFNQLTTALHVGATLVIERSTLVQQIIATIHRERVTVLAAVPPLWQQLLGVAAFRERPIPSLRIMTNAGGRLPPASVVELRRAQPQARLFLMYGLTEVFRSTFLPPEEVDAHPDSMGRAVPESVVYVVREDGTQAATDEVGELVHGGPSVGIGYMGDAEATARVFRDNPFLGAGEDGPRRVVYSGDLVRRDAEGRLFHVGRRDRMIKTLGFRVSPDEICDVIQASGMVVEAAVVSEPDAQRGERIVGIVVLKAEATLEQLRRYCGVELPRYMQPARFVTLAAIPRNGSGKHDIPTLKSTLVAGAAAVAEGA